MNAAGTDPTPDDEVATAHELRTVLREKEAHRRSESFLRWMLPAVVLAAVSAGITSVGLVYGWQPSHAFATLSVTFAVASLAAYWLGRLR